MDALNTSAVFPLQFELALPYTYLRKIVIFNVKNFSFIFFLSIYLFQKYEFKKRRIESQVYI